MRRSPQPSPASPEQLADSASRVDLHQVRQFVDAVTAPRMNGNLPERSVTKELPGLMAGVVADYVRFGPGA